MELGITKCSPNDGKLNVKADKAVKFSFTVKNSADITKVQLGIGEKKKYRLQEIEYSNSGATLGFTYKFKDTDSGPVTVLVNGKEFVQYYVEVE